ncbi:hypothetical protein ACWDUN_06655 [Mycobacterium sp. NPDC003323]
MTVDLFDYRQLIDFNPARPEPLYYQIGVAIAVAVTQERIPSGVPVPSVQRLAQNLDIASSTARNVLGYLDRHRYIERIGRRRFLVAPGDRSRCLADARAVGG